VFLCLEVNKDFNVKTAESFIYYPSLWL
jgi:hypothetical protein